MKKLGFGCMRLPMQAGEVDVAAFSEMVDLFLSHGFTYFDTAHGYIDGKSEPAVRAALTSRYPRERYQLADKLTTNHFEQEADIRPLFESQLAACGVDYFDCYLMHAQNAAFYEKYVRCNAYHVATALKAEGKIRHIGISFHDKASVLEKILSEQPCIEFVQLQFNYVDYDDPGIQSRACYEVCERYGKPVVVMEPVKGGSLADPPEAAKAVLDDLGGGSYASYAIRFAASFRNNAVVLSGMSNVAQMEDNISFMEDFRPLDETERAAIDRIAVTIRKGNRIPCTACRYCTAGCPAHISIPDLFACVNGSAHFKDWNPAWYYMVYTTNAGRASDCIGCGQCEELCPQRLPIRKLLKEIAAEFDAEETAE